VALTRRLRLVTSGVLVFVALAIAAASGDRAIYLRAHWWSDVGGAGGSAPASSRCWRRSPLSSSIAQWGTRAQSRRAD
jgi:hypothetical protein